MTSETGDSSERECRLHEVLGAYFEAVEAGRAPGREELVARHPDLAADLDEFFAEQDRFHRLVEPLRREAPEPWAEVPTEPQEGPEGPVEQTRDFSPAATLPRGVGADVTTTARAHPEAPNDGDDGEAELRGARVRYFGDYELLAGDRPRRHGRRLPGPAGQPQPPRRPQDDPRRRRWPARTTCGGSRSRPRRSPSSTTRTSCRSTRSASTTASTTSA